MESSPSETNKDKYTEIRELFWSQISKIEFGIFDDEVQKFYNKIKDTYSPEEYQHCVLWHLIIASTPNETDINFDTPGGEIEDFIRNRLPEIIKNQ